MGVSEVADVGLALASNQLPLASGCVLKSDLLITGASGIAWNILVGIAVLVLS